MAYNYTVSEYIFTEAVTDAVYAGNMVSGGTMTITPNSGYVVSAANFSASGTLPAQFASIAFTDTAVAGEINNTVTVTFVFSTVFEMSPTLNNINLPITGHADLVEDKRQISFDFDFIDNTTENINGGISSITGGYVGSTTGSPIETTNIDSANLTSNPTIDANNNIIIATIQLTADSNFHFNNNATITVENAPENTEFFLVPQAILATNSEDQVTNRFYYLKINSEVSVPSFIGCKVFIHYEGIADLNSTKEIREVIYGEPEISIKGATRRIKIVGDVNVEFDLTVTKNSDNTSIMDTGLANADIAHSPGGIIRGLNKTLTSTDTNQLFATYEFIQEFPSSSSNEIYHINVTPKGGAILNSNLPQTAPQGIIYQYINPTITLVASGFRGSGGNPANIVYTGRPNKKPSQLTNIKTIAEFFQINYQLTHTHAISKAGTITWSSTGTSSWTNSAYDNVSTTPANHGNHIEIVNIVHDADGSTTASLTADVIVKKFGTADVTMTIDLDSFFTVP